MVLVRVIGGVSAIADTSDAEAHELPIGGPRQQRVLAALVAHEGPISVARLTAAVWPEEEDVPDDPRRALQTYVSRLRGAGMPIERSGDGYAFGRGVRSDIDVLDEALTASDRLAAAGDAQGALVELDAAVAAVSGPAFGDFADEPWAHPAAVAVEESRIVAQEQRARLQIDVGTPEAALADLRALTVREPLRERPHRLLALALHLSGDRTGAIRLYQAFRSRAVEETGLEPSEDFRALEAQILAGDRVLEPVARTRLGSYDLGELIGEGSFGAIYRATQPSVDREVAIKVVRPEMANDPAFVRRFEVEAQTVARLEHPHIVPLFDYWRDPSGAYLVMRYLRGGSAEERLVRDGPLPLAAVSQLVDEVGGALAAAHERGVVHRDVKPANILYDEDGHAYLADFGIAVDAGVGAGADLRSAGSPLYAAPEQVRDGASSVGSDIYAFGVVLYELLTGLAPFAGADSLHALLERKVRDRLAPVTVSRPDCPGSIDLVVQTATHPDTERRFESMGELVLAYRAAAGGARPDATATDLDTDERPRRSATRTLVSLEIEAANPYRGLAAFDEADRTNFFGRDDLTADLLDRVAGSRLVVVTGPSGSGKSSLVRAGLAPAARERGMLVSTVIPGSRPFQQLETALRRIATSPTGALAERLAGDPSTMTRTLAGLLPDDVELLLVIDQFEELFTLAVADDRDRFLTALASVASDDRSRVRVVCTLRADFYDRPLQHPAICDLVQANTLAVTPLSGLDLDDAITQPAARMGVTAEPTLVAELVAQVSAHPSTLPLMQWILTELYERRDSGRMTLEAYHSMGGLTGALAQRADELHDSLPEESRTHVRRLFARLVTPGEGTEDTRRRVRRADIAGVDGAVIDAYGAARLLSFDHDPDSREPTVEVAHEALIREWPRLRGWIDDGRDGLRILRHLGDAARVWDAGGRDSGELYRGGRLEAAEEWAGEHRVELTRSEAEFLAASIELREGDALAERRRLRRLRLLLGATALVAAAALVAGWVALRQRERADENAFTAETRRLVADAVNLADDNRDIALLLAVEAHTRNPSAATSGALLNAMAAADGYLGTIGSGESFIGGGLLEDGTVVGVTSAEVIFYDAQTWEERSRVMLPAPTSEIAVTRELVDIAEGEVAVGLGTGEVAIVAPDEVRPLTVVPVSAEPLTSVALVGADAVAVVDRAGELRMVERDGDVQWVIDPLPEESFEELMGAEAYSGLGTFAETLSSFDELVFRIGTASLAVESGDSLLIGIGPYLRRVANADGTILQSLLVQNAPIPGVPAFPRVIKQVDATSVPDSIVLLAGTTAIVFVDRELGSATFDTAGGVTDTSAVAFDHLGRPWFSSGSIGVLGVSTVSDPDAPASVDVGLAAASHIEAAPGDAQVLVFGPGGAVMWATDGSQLLARALAMRGNTGAYISGDGRQATVTSVGGSVDSLIYDLSTAIPTARTLPAAAPGSEIFPGGPSSSYVGALANSRLELYDRDTLDPLGFDMSYVGIAAGFSPDGRWLALATGGDRVTVFDLGRQGAEVVTLDLDRWSDEGDENTGVIAAVFDATSTRLLLTLPNGTGVVFETARWTPTTTLTAADSGGAVAARFSQDGSLLVTRGLGGEIVVRDADTLEVLDSLEGGVSASRGFSPGPYLGPDNRYLLTVRDGTPRLFDLVESQLVGAFPHRPELRASGSDYGALRLMTIVGDNALSWNLDVATWPDIACRAAGRNLSSQEWEQFGPQDTSHRATCEQWPLSTDPG